MFYKGIQFGIKQPYLVCSYGGIHSLRNDNPINILFKTKIAISNNSIQSTDNLESLKYKANEWLQKKQYI